MDDFVSVEILMNAMDTLLSSDANSEMTSHGIFIIIDDITWFIYILMHSLKNILWQEE